MCVCVYRVFRSLIASKISYAGRKAMFRSAKDVSTLGPINLVGYFAQRCVNEEFRSFCEEKNVLRRRDATLPEPILKFSSREIFILKFSIDT